MNGQENEIMDLARQAGFSEWAVQTPNDLIAFYKLAVAKEREACAKVCDELHWEWHMGDNSGPKECAETIRARL